MKPELDKVTIPDESGAEERAWRVVRQAYAQREGRPRSRRRGRSVSLAIAVGLLIALVAGSVSLAGSSLARSVRKAVGLSTAAPALTKLPADGRLLTTSAKGPWIVQRDGSKRLLGPYTDASWSPHGLYLAAVRAHELLAVDPHGTVHWSLARTGLIADPRWSPDGFRIAYRDGRNLRIVAGDGTGDRPLAAGVAPVAPAWRPSTDHQHVLAFVVGSQLRLIDVDTGRLEAHQHLSAPVEELEWSDDGGRLIAASAHLISVFSHDGKPLGSVRIKRPIESAAIAPRSHRLALILAGTRTDTVALDLDHLAARPKLIFSGTGAFTDLAWSPDGRWLLLGWKTADQWLFVRPADGRVTAVSSIAEQLSPGSKTRRFPSLNGWCCS